MANKDLTRDEAREQWHAKTLAEKEPIRYPFQFLLKLKGYQLHIDLIQELVAKFDISDKSLMVNDGDKPVVLMEKDFKVILKNENNNPTKTQRGVRPTDFNKKLFLIKHESGKEVVCMKAVEVLTGKKEMEEEDMNIDVDMGLYEGVQESMLEHEDKKIDEEITKPIRYQILFLGFADLWISSYISYINETFSDLYVMLPWESMPLLKNQEVYRMPSIASISCTYDRCCHIQEKVGKDSAVSPMIDPLDAYYLLNPGGDLSETEAEFGAWFKDQNLEETSGTSPTVDELSVALKNHDLFIYLGHGSGSAAMVFQQVLGRKICDMLDFVYIDSGSLSLNGPYMPKGAPLHYLFAGSPVIIANLWDVTDKDIDRFGKAMLDAWITARSTSSLDCAQCTEIADKLKELNIDEGSTSYLEPLFGSFMGNALQACALPFLIGAAPACYGVPTGIRKKNL
ncbi:separase [Tanacetum coccineum]